MNIGDRSAPVDVSCLHQGTKNDGIPVDRVNLLHGTPDRGRIAIGTVANMHLMQAG